MPRASSEAEALRDVSISFVVIGLDEAENLAESIASLSKQGLERAQFEIIYVDSGSLDDSVAIAREAGVDRLLSIPREGANAARARNFGLKNVTAPFVHFVDGDTRLEPGWLQIGLRALESDPTLIGVEGDLREVSPAASLYTAVCELDWPSSPGEVDYVGGNALYRVEPLRDAGSFDPEMRVGEEPELGARLRRRGWRMRHLDTVMAWHHLGIRSLPEYLRRNYTSGIACALVAQKTGGLTRGYWSGRLCRTLADAAFFTVPIALALPLSITTPISGLAVASITPLLLIALALRKAIVLRNQGFEGRLPLAFGLHAYISKLPSALGILSAIRPRRAVVHRSGLR